MIPESFDHDGFCVIEGVLGADEVAALRNAVGVDGGRGGVRNLLDVPEMRALAGSAAMRKLVEAILGPEASVVRGILFDKTSDANWKVPWHQDVTISVAQRLEVEGYGPWSNKAGVTHVQPPASVLEQMVSVRIHLDDCPAENGALKVIAGSHRDGKVAEARIAEVVAGGNAVVCAAGIGGVLMMRPLLVHSSSSALMPAHRRVVHFDYAACNLANGLQWASSRRVEQLDRNGV